MKKFLIFLFAMFLSINSVLAAKFPIDVKNYIKNDFVKTDFRFDGLVILPDDTIYLPLYPALVKKPAEIKIKQTFPVNKNLKDRPDIVIFNNDFVLMKMLYNKDGSKTVLRLDNPPVEVKTGLLPQDLLVPKGFKIPDNIKGIIGNLEIQTTNAPDLRVSVNDDEELKFVNSQKNVQTKPLNIPELKNKVMYVATCYSKNLQVINAEQRNVDYALSLKSIPIDIALTPDEKFLMATSFGNNFIEVISLSDEQVIKKFEFTSQPTEIVIDKKNNKAYIALPEDSSIFVIDIPTMTLKQQIKINGYCERLSINPELNILIYFDKKTSEIFSVELNHEFIIKNIGKFPNVSKLLYSNNKLYMLSRTKNRLAIVDYVTMGVLAEMEMDKKPIDILKYKNNIYVLCADTNILYVINGETDEVISKIRLNTKGFSTNISPIKNTKYAIITDTKSPKYVLVDLDKNQVIKTYAIDVPVSKMIIANKVLKINKKK